ncbi:3-isopropylmalate/(R)-2-methylmalate dehydratase large subunit [Lewinella aquimaris]|uniref:3-isopropylmalate dehydratase large subunit n=1 Tax=Neolewinella aquimaris TaxID=1835722 RepID=A0A840EGH2_9BACT|nr:3-isopropylmalate dehydratase large subunit [Neolewinella aquimaris]MBB4079996.1 3-isopropylmalate/(R)-2-methylmalate dehydratase large subunit [Neolewinella aquimaris]
MPTLFDKVWDAHVVTSVPGGAQVLYIDRHLIHEVTSPQAFNGLRQRGIPLLRRDRIVATADHNVPTKDQDKPIAEPLSRKQVEMLTTNCAEFGVELYGLGHPYQGIVHVIGPELGITRPGITMVCGDSHTSTHGAFGAIAFGIGTSQVEQVMATQCVLMEKPRKMRINIEGDLQPGVTAKDLILYVIAKLGTGGGTGHFVEYAGSAIRSLSMEGRMTVCNMSIEMGARGGLIAPDQTTFDYLEGREFAPKREEWEKAVAHWRTLPTDADATFDIEYTYRAEEIPPMITYGTNPGMGMGVKDRIPQASALHGEASMEKAMQYMDLEIGKPMEGMPVDYVFIGSCTNSRIEDLRLAGSLVQGKRIAANVTGIVVPGSQQVAKQAIAEGLDRVFEAAGFEFRGAGCSACLGMNEDKVPAGRYCVSTSNRNFEGRQGPGARTILASPLTAAAAAVAGKIVDVREFKI